MACYPPNGIPEETDPKRIKINKLFVDKDNKIEDLIEVLLDELLTIIEK